MWEVLIHMKNRLRLLKISAIGIGLTILVICYCVSGSGKIRLVLPDADSTERTGEETAGLTEDILLSDISGAETEKAEDGNEPGEKQSFGEADVFGEDEIWEETGESPVSSEAADSTFIFVHVCGAVQQPGVYELEYGSRVYQAVDAAGGLAPEAASDFVNMALVLQDGQQLRIPDRQEAEEFEKLQGIKEDLYITPAGGASDTTGGAASHSGNTALINLNTATKEELMTLSGIGEAKAEAILAYRNEQGAFRTVEDVMKVPGIKEAAFQKIKDSITV